MPSYVLFQVFLNVFVLYYHAVHAPHPKYVILKQRRFSIYIHIISGILEFTACLIAFITGNIYFAKVAALAAILAHVPTAYYQTSIAFGAKAILIASYSFYNFSSSFPLRYICLSNQIPLIGYSICLLIHNVYVWCRIFYFIFSFVGLFKDTLYTNSILSSCLILFPAVLGVSGNMLLLGYVAISISLYLIIVRPDEADRALYVEERTRDLLVDKVIYNQWLKEKLRLTKITEEHELTDQTKSQTSF